MPMRGSTNFIDSFLNGAVMVIPFVVIGVLWRLAQKAWRGGKSTAQPSIQTGNSTHTQVAPPTEITTPPTPTISTAEENELYTRVGEEIAKNKLKPGLAARAAEQSMGNPDLAKSLYVKFRIAELQKEKEQEAAEREAVEQRKREAAEKREQQRREAEWNKEQLRLAAEEEREQQRKAEELAERFRRWREDEPRRIAAAAVRRRRIRVWSIVVVVLIGCSVPFCRDAVLHQRKMREVRQQLAVEQARERQRLAAEQRKEARLRQERQRQQQESERQRRELAARQRQEAEQRRREFMVLDLGGGVKMEFVWLAALNGWVGKYEVTNEEYRRYMPDHNSGERQGRSLNGDRQPVANVSYDEAVAYAKRISQLCSGELPGGYQVRLPDGNEWMTFAQCGDEREYPWGDGVPPKYGNYYGTENSSDRSVVSCPVEKSGKNDWGLYGVGGNVWEWTSDKVGADMWAWTGNSYNQKPVSRVLRGASWGSGADKLCCTFCCNFEPYNRDCYSGFRLVVLR